MLVVCSFADIRAALRLYLTKVLISIFSTELMLLIARGRAPHAVEGVFVIICRSRRRISSCTRSHGKNAYRGSRSLVFVARSR